MASVASNVVPNSDHLVSYMALPIFLTALWAFFNFWLHNQGKVCKLNKPWRAYDQLICDKIRTFENEVLGKPQTNSNREQVPVVVRDTETRVVNGLQHFIMTANGFDKVLVYRESTPNSDPVFMALKRLEPGEIISVMLGNASKDTDKVRDFVGFARDDVVFSDERLQLKLQPLQAVAV